jgi:hypothetical protein
MCGYTLRWLTLRPKHWFLEPELVLLTCLFIQNLCSIQCTFWEKYWYSFSHKVGTDPGSYKFTIRTKRKWTKNANETNERFTRTIRKMHDTRNECSIHERTKWNERTIRKTQTNERTIHERTNHWSVTIYYPMTNDPGSIELTNLIFYTQLIYINDKLVSKVIG